MHADIVRGLQENTSYDFTENKFNNKQYKEARTLFEELLKNQPNQGAYAYYLALTYFGDDNWKKAIDQLGPIAMGNYVFAGEAKYYLAIAYYKNGNPDKASDLLRQLDNTIELRKKAQKLLGKIN